MYSSSCNVAPAISRVLIGRYLIFAHPHAVAFLENVCQLNIKGSLHTTIVSKYTELLQLKNIFRIF